MNGQSIVIKGEISGAEDLVIAGRVEGKIKLDGCVLTLAPGSQVIGDVSAGTLIVSGQIEGEDIGTAQQQRLEKPDPREEGIVARAVKCDDDATWPPCRAEPVGRRGLVAGGGTKVNPLPAHVVLIDQPPESLLIG